MKHAKPLVIVGGFWVALFLFVVAGMAGSFGLEGVTGYAVKEDGSPTAIGVQSIAILFLFFTNIVTLFFLTRKIIEK